MSVNRELTEKIEDLIGVVESLTSGMDTLVSAVGDLATKTATASEKSEASTRAEERLDAKIDTGRKKEGRAALKRIGASASQALADSLGATGMAGTGQLGFQGAQGIGFKVGGSILRDIPLIGGALGALQDEVTAPIDIATQRVNAITNQIARFGGDVSDETRRMLHDRFTDEQLRIRSDQQKNAALGLRKIATPEAQEGTVLGAIGDGLMSVWDRLANADIFK